MTRRVISIVLLVMAAGPAWAAQSLIPTPYPSAAPGAAPLNPETPRAGPQEIMKDPYPQATGDNSQGNPSTMRRRGGQRLIPSANQRKYGVDRPAR